jgi:hypothetical protein
MLIDTILILSIFLELVFILTLGIIFIVDILQILEIIFYSEIMESLPYLTNNEGQSFLLPELSVEPRQVVQLPPLRVWEQAGIPH